VRLPEQRHDPQAVELALVVEAIVAALFAGGLQQPLLLPEAQRRHPHPDELRRRADVQGPTERCCRRKCRFRQDAERRERPFYSAAQNARP